VLRRVWVPRSVRRHPIWLCTRSFRRVASGEFVRLLQGPQQVSFDTCVGTVPSVMDRSFECGSLSSLARHSTPDKHAHHWLCAIDDAVENHGERNVGFIPGPGHITPMQQKTEGRVVRLLIKHLSAEDHSVEQWFLVAIGDDDKARDAIAKSTKISS
jgi:hypothetical protein